MQPNERVPRPTHLITNLVCRLQLHHHRNLSLRSRLDTCADVNLMPASMYQLVFSDPNMKKLAPSKLQVGTYMTDTMKDHWILYISPGTSKYQEASRNKLLCGDE